VDCNHVGDVILVTGKDYPPNTRVEQLCIDGNPSTVFIEGDEGELTSKNEIITSKSGSFKVRVQVPTRSIGPMTITVGSASTTFKVKPNITIELETDDTKATLSGNGFAKDEKISISFGEKNIPTSADANGCWQEEVTVDAQSGIIDVIACGELSRQCVETTFRIPYSIYIAEGWNLISFPGVIDSSLESLLKPPVLQLVEPVRKSGEIVDWRRPDTLKFGEAYWVLASKEHKLQVQLIPESQYTRKLLRGWNLIGSPFGEACIPEGVIQLSRWNAEKKETERASLIEWGLGYWALAIKDCEITVDGTKPCIPAPPLQRSITRGRKSLTPLSNDK
jgi:hypothetical protein